MSHCLKQTDKTGLEHYAGHYFYMKVSSGIFENIKYKR